MDNPLGTILGAVNLLDEGGFAMDVPVDVYLLGFDATVAAPLGERLSPTEIDHAAGQGLPDYHAGGHHWHPWR